MTAAAERIRALNDTLRTTGQGGDILVTSGLAALAPSRLGFPDQVRYGVTYIQITLATAGTMLGGRAYQVPTTELDLVRAGG